MWSELKHKETTFCDLAGGWIEGGDGWHTPEKIAQMLIQIKRYVRYSLSLSPHVHT